MRALLLIGVAICFGIWYWRKSYVPSFLEVHFNDLEAKQNVGNLAQMASYAAPPPWTTMAQGWGTTAQVNPNNPASLTHNRPGKLVLNPRFLRPTSASLNSNIHPLKPGKPSVTSNS